MASRHFIAGPGSTLRLRAKFYKNKVLTDPYSFPSGVGIYLVPTGGPVQSTIAPTQKSVGIWYVDYTLPTGFVSTSLYDEWTWIGEVGMANSVQRFASEIELTVVPTPPAGYIDSPSDAVAQIFSAVPKSQKTPPQSGFTVKAVPRSVREAVSQQSHDRLKSITKSAVEHYIRSFLDTEGKNREAIESVAKGSLQFVTDKSLQTSEDKTKRATQLSRIFNELRERIPAILIVDAGMQSVPSGLMSGLMHATLFEGKWQGWFNKQFRVPLTIAVVTADQESTDQLMELIELAFNNLRQIGGGSEIRPTQEGHNWAVRLPLSIDISATSGVNITEDTKDQLWFAEFSMTVESEDTFAIEMPFDTSLDRDDYARAISQGGHANESDLASQVPPVITAPDEIQINTVASVSFARLRLNHRIVIDNPQIATIDVESRTIRPRRLGTFNLQVVDFGNRQEKRRALAPTVIAEKTITVTL